jgi:hypothetical protein
MKQPKHALITDVMRKYRLLIALKTTSTQNDLPPPEVKHKQK